MLYGIIAVELSQWHHRHSRGSVELLEQHLAAASPDLLHVVNRLFVFERGVPL
jgi:hypothetical protein